MTTSEASKRMWVPLSFGFGTLLLLILLATLVSLTRGVAIFRQLSEAHERHYRVGEALLRLRSDLYLAGIVKRDFLLDRNRAETYGEQFKTIQASVDDSLEIIQQTVGPTQTAAMDRLRKEVQAYMRPMTQALDWEPVETSALRWYLLRLQLRQRTAALQIAGDIEKLNQEALLRQQTRITQAEADFRKTLILIALVGMSLGLVIAVSTLVHTRNLEKHSVEVQGELRRLSNQLVKVQEHERRSISRELHDEVGQILTGLRMELANLDGPRIQQHPGDFHHLQEAKRLAERTLQTVRSMSMLLRPSMLDDLGLSPAVNWQAKEFSRRSGIPVDISIQGEVDSVPDEVRTCLYRVVQEALTNVARHANARRIRLAMRRRGEFVTADVEDDGSGFVPSKSNLQGVGLLGIKERVEELSGTVHISSFPGKGTRVFVELPVPREVPA